MRPENKRAQDKFAAPRVLVVDDQSFMRIALRQILEAEGDIRVVGEAQNGREAVSMARDLKPDVVTLDIEMPEMDGLEACAEIVRSVSPRPIIIMVSAHTQAGADASVKALRLGAVDFISKSSGFVKTDLAHIDSELRRKVRAWAKPRPVVHPDAASPSPVQEAAAWHPDIIVIAASTGGPQALTALLANHAPAAAPIVIAQHMPELFTASLAQALSHDTGHTVTEGSHRQALAPQSVTLIPGGRDGVIAPRGAGKYELRLTKTDGNVHPSANALFESAALVASAPAGIVLTGMGEDGAKGAAALRRKGVPVLVQTPSSCIVSGMPEAALSAAPGSEVLSLARISDRIGIWSERATTASAADMSRTP